MSGSSCSNHISEKFIASSRISNTGYVVLPVLVNVESPLPLRYLFSTVISALTGRTSSGYILNPNIVPGLVRRHNQKI